MKDWPDSASTNRPDQPDQLHALFSRLLPQDVEDFYKTYQHWLLQHRIQWLQAQVVTTRRHISENMHEMETVQPSSTAQAVLARLRVHGVQDVDLLDRLLEHNDSWLNHTIQLLEQCEFLGFIQDNYTEWCEYALEGAYDWITSMNVNYDNQFEYLISTPSLVVTNPEAKESDTLPQATEEELLQKLMSEEDDETVKRPSIKPPTIQIQHEAIGTDMNGLDPKPSDVQTSETASPAAPHESQQAAITRPLTSSTQPLPMMERSTEVQPIGRVVHKRDETAFIAAQSSSIAVAAPQRGPVWRLFNVLARFFFAT